MVVCDSGCFVVPNLSCSVAGTVVTLNVYSVAIVVRSLSSDIIGENVVRFSVLVGDFGVVIDSSPPGTSGLAVILTSGPVVDSSSIGSKKTTESTKQKALV